MTLVYKIQHKETGKGPFFSNAWSNKTKHKEFIEGSMAASKPKPFIDNPNFKFGVIDLNHLRFWFNKSFHKLLSDSGFITYLYEVEKDNIKLFDRQCIILDIKKAKLVRTEDIGEILAYV